MDSATFYRIIDTTFASECQRLGFERQRGTVSLWVATLSGGFFFYEVSKGVKNPYLPVIGGRFQVNCDLTNSNARSSRSLDSFISYMEYFSDGDLETMRSIQDQVLTKIVSQRPTGDFERSLLEAHAPMLKFGIGLPFHRNGVFTIPYLDEDDVSAWGQFLASRLEKTLGGVKTAPRFFMRLEKLT